MRRVIRGIEQGWSPVVEDRLAAPDEWGVIKLSAVNRGVFSQNEHKALPAEAALAVRLEIRAGDVLMTRANSPELVGDACSVRATRPRLMLCDLAYRLSVRSDILNPIFLTYWLLSQPGREQVAADARESSRTMVKVSKPHVRSWLVAMPPIGRQRRIVGFLDRKTSIIDALIAKKQRLVELLREKRHALITHAVTKGLDSRAPMKPSGIDWLGDIPAPWTVFPLRRLLRGIERGSSPASEDRPADKGEWAVLKLGAVVKGRFRPGEHKALPLGVRPERRCEVHAGDLLLTRSNSPALVGDACYVEATPPRLMLPDLIYRLSVHRDLVHPHYLARFLLSAVGRAQVMADARASNMTMAKVSGIHIRSWVMPLPPSLGEQQAIETMLDQKCGAIDDLQYHLDIHIERLREYRQALITAAVTGKIDVSSEAA
jgi:type I restriction enzyme S subunit